MGSKVPWEQISPKGLDQHAIRQHPGSHQGSKRIGESRIPEPIRAGGNQGVRWKRKRNLIWRHTTKNENVKRRHINVGYRRSACWWRKKRDSRRKSNQHWCWAYKEKHVDSDWTKTEKFKKENSLRIRKNITERKSGGAKVFLSLNPWTKTTPRRKVGQIRLGCKSTNRDPKKNDFWGEVGCYRHKRKTIIQKRAPKVVTVLREESQKRTICPESIPIGQVEPKSKEVTQEKHRSKDIRSRHPERGK